MPEIDFYEGNKWPPTIDCRSWLGPRLLAWAGFTPGAFNACSGQLTLARKHLPECAHMQRRRAAMFFAVRSAEE